MNQTPDARSIFAPIWRWKWLILAVAIFVGAASYLYYKREKPTFEVSTQIFLGASSEEAAPGGKAGGKSKGSGDQAAIVNSIVVEEVRGQLVKAHKQGLIRNVSVRAKLPEKTEFMSISTVAHSARSAAFVANAVAQA